MLICFARTVCRVLQRTRFFPVRHCCTLSVLCFLSFLQTNSYGSSLFPCLHLFPDGSFGFHPDTKAVALELLCFHTDGCSAGFDRPMLQKALKPKILERYDELQSQLTLEQAGLRDTIWYVQGCLELFCSSIKKKKNLTTCLCYIIMCRSTCPKCGYSAALPDEQRVFLCPVEDCRFESCRNCRWVEGLVTGMDSTYMVKLFQFYEFMLTTLIAPTLTFILNHCSCFFLFLLLCTEKRATCH